MPDQRLSLLMYSPLSLRTGAGGDRWLAEVASRLRKRGIQPTVVATDFVMRSYRATTTNYFVKRLRSSGVNYVELPASRLSRLVNGPILGFGGIKRLSNLMRRNHALYFINAFALQDVFVTIAKFLSDGRPVTSGQHSTLFQDSFLHDGYIETVFRLLLNRFNSYHVINGVDYSKYKQWGLKHVRLIPNGVNTDLFSPTDNHPDKFKVLFTGRLAYQKGVDVLLKAIKILEARNALDFDINFAICGTGPLKDKVVKYAERSQYLTYEGFVAEEKLPDLYRSASLFVMPSRRETFGLVAVEAMASGIPVLVTDTPGPKTFVRSNYGRIVPADDALTLANTIDWFYNLFKESPAELRRMGHNARLAAVRDYNWEIVADRISTLVKTTVNPNAL